MGAWPFTHAVDVRYGECDQQGIVFNSHYLAFVDDAMDHWMRSLGNGVQETAQGAASSDGRSEAGAAWITPGT